MICRCFNQLINGCHTHEVHHFCMVKDTRVAFGGEEHIARRCAKGVLSFLLCCPTQNDVSSLPVFCSHMRMDQERVTY